MVDVHERIIAEHAFGKDLAARHIEQLARTSDVRFEAGAFLFHEGEPATHFYSDHARRHCAGDVHSGARPSPNRHNPGR